MCTYLYFLDDLNAGRFDFHADGDYRFYFLNDHVIGQVAFQAEDDDRALEIAKSSSTSAPPAASPSWRVWVRDVFLARGPRTVGARLGASDLTELRLEKFVRCGETILNSDWPVASSVRLLAELDRLKRAKGRVRYQ